MTQPTSKVYGGGPDIAPGSSQTGTYQYNPGSGGSTQVSPNIITMAPGTFPTAPVAAPTGTPVIPSGLLSQNVQPLALPQQPTLSNTNALVSGFSTALQSPKSEYEQKYDEAIKTRESLIDRVLGKGDRYNRLQKEYDIPGQVQRLNEANLQFAQKRAAYDTAYNKVSNEPIMLANITGRQAYIQRQAAIDLGAQAATIQAMQGNLTLAKQTINETIDHEYEPIESAIQYQTQSIQLLGDSPEADRYKAQLQQQADDIEYEKKLKQTMSQNAMIAGDFDTAQAIMKIQGGQPGSTEQILKLGGKYLQSESDALDIKYKKAQIANTYSQIAERNKSSDETNAFKFTAEDKQLLVGSGFAGNDLKAIENDLNKYGVEQVLNNPSTTESQKATLKQVLNKSNTPASKPFLSEDFFKTTYGDTLKTAAKDAGFTTGGFFGLGKSGDTDAYLKDIMKKVEAYRAAGYTDQEILKLMQ